MKNSEFAFLALVIAGAHAGISLGLVFVSLMFTDVAVVGPVLTVVASLLTLPLGLCSFVMDLDAVLVGWLIIPNSMLWGLGLAYLVRRTVDSRSAHRSLSI